MHVLNTGDIVTAATNADIPGAAELIRSIEQAQNRLADLVATHFGITHVTTDFGIGEIGSSFAPAIEGQECPEELVSFDEGSDWVDDPEGTETYTPRVDVFKDAGRLPPAPLAYDISQTPFTIKDQAGEYEDVTGALVTRPHGVAVRVSGYTDNASQDDLGELFTLTRNEDQLQLCVFADVNKEEPTHSISLEGARNLNRETSHSQ